MTWRTPVLAVTGWAALFAATFIGHLYGLNEYPDWMLVPAAMYGLALIPAAYWADRAIQRRREQQ